MTSLGTYPSSVTKSNGSFRTTIPLAIAKALKLEHKSKITWELLVDEKYGACSILRKQNSGSSTLRSPKG